MSPTLSVNHLSLNFQTKSNTPLKAVRDLSFTIEKGQTLALVGESGSGKSITAHAILGLLPGGCSRVSGDIHLCGERISDLSWSQMAKIRGKKIGYVFQDPMASLNPTLPIFKQIEETLILHTSLGKAQRKERVVELLELVEIPNPESRLYDYPHEFSGGQRQRIMIAIAIACNPKLLIADEPTTALDVTVQTQIIKLLKKLQLKTGIGLLFISHDLSLVSTIADHICVMYAGDLVELAPAALFLKSPKHPYSKALIKAIPADQPPLSLPQPISGKLPHLAQISENLNRCQFAPRCQVAMEGCLKALPDKYPVHSDPSCTQSFVRCFAYHPEAPQSVEKRLLCASAPPRSKNKKNEETPVILEAKDLCLTYKKPASLFDLIAPAQPSAKPSLKSVSIQLQKGKTLGLVGESGSGKSSLAKCLTRVIQADSGQILLDGSCVDSSKDSLYYSKKVQMIFQDPYSSLNPRMTLFQILKEPLELHNICTGRAVFTRVTKLLQYVGLPASAMNCYPHQFSGGQRQRIGIARALAVEPEVLIADEPVSSLDVSIQAQIIQLLLDLQEKLGLSYLFIGHDLALIRLISDDIAVMHRGEIVEYENSETLFQNPRHDYTKKLIASIPKNLFDREC